MPGNNADGIGFGYWKDLAIDLCYSPTWECGSEYYRWWCSRGGCSAVSTMYGEETIADDTGLVT